MGSSAVRFDNAIKYVTPSFNGFSGGLLYVAKNTKAKAGTASTTSTISQAFDYSSTIGAYDYAGVQELAVKYNNGPINAVFANQVTNAYDVEGLTGALGMTKRTLNTFGGNYAFGNGLSALLHYQNYKTVGGTNSETDYVAAGVSYVMGSNTFMAQAGEYKLKSSDSSAAAAYVGKKSKLWSLGYDYALSKRTAVYARYESIDDKANAITKVATLDNVTDGKRTRTAIGLRHAF